MKIVSYAIMENFDGVNPAIEECEIDYREIDEFVWCEIERRMDLVRIPNVDSDGWIMRVVENCQETYYV